MVLAVKPENDPVVVGQRVGYLTVLGELRDPRNRGARVRCRCDCGRPVTLTRSRLLGRGATRVACGWDCPVAHDRASALVGRRFGLLVVVDVGERGRSLVCRCDCGKLGTYLVSALTGTGTRTRRRSCGYGCPVAHPSRYKPTDVDLAPERPARPGEHCVLCGRPAHRAVVLGKSVTPFCLACRTTTSDVSVTSS